MITTKEIISFNQPKILIMKKQQETSPLHVTEKFDRELIKILSKDLKTVKTTKARYISKSNDDNNLLVA
jgi:hypothetical protein